MKFPFVIQRRATLDATLAAHREETAHHKRRANHLLSAAESAICGMAKCRSMSIEIENAHRALGFACNYERGALDAEAGGAHRPARYRTFLEDQNARLRAFIANPPKHDCWGAGEPDCPPDLKASNGELHTLRCKVCGNEDARDQMCLSALREFVDV